MCKEFFKWYFLKIAHAVVDHFLISHRMNQVISFALYSVSTTQNVKFAKNAEISLKIFAP